METKKALKRGSFRVYFPEHPNSELNGATFQHMGKSYGERYGLIVRRKFSVFEDSIHNQSVSAGYLDEAFEITPEMFGKEQVVVNFWANGALEESFILESELSLTEKKLSHKTK